MIIFRGGFVANQKMEIELTEEQARKVEILQSNGISVGEAIDMLFEVKEKAISIRKEILDARISNAQKEKEELENKIANLDKSISLLNKLNDDDLDLEEKHRIVENEHGTGDESYEMKIQRVKHNVSWAKDFFKF